MTEVLCSKIRFHTRGDAKAYLKKMPWHDGLRPYKCPRCPFWHLGHLPRAILRGEKTRGDIYGR